MSAQRLRRLAQHSTLPPRALTSDTERSALVTSSPLPVGVSPPRDHRYRTDLRARSAALEWVKEQLELVVDARRVASVSEDIETLAIGILTLHLDFGMVVRLLGGRKPSRKGTSGYGAGTWGSHDEASYKVSVPLAMERLGHIITRLWGEGLGCHVSDEADFGIARRARDAVSQLSAANALAFFTDYFERLSMAAERFRTRRGTAVPDLEALGEESEETKLEPIISKQDAEAAAEARATELFNARAAQLLAQAQAGIKRTAAGTPTATMVVAKTAAFVAVSIARRSRAHRRLERACAVCSSAVDDAPCRHRRPPRPS